MTLTVAEATRKKEWLKGQLKSEFGSKGATFSVGLSGGQHDFVIRVMGSKDISFTVKRKVLEWLPQSNPDVRYISHIKPV